jgi:hypothetical protein
LRTDTRFTAALSLQDQHASARATGPLHSERIAGMRLEVTKAGKQGKRPHLKFLKWVETAALLRATTTSECQQGEEARAVQCNACHLAEALLLALESDAIRTKVLLAEAVADVVQAARVEGAFAVGYLQPARHSGKQRRQLPRASWTPARTHLAEAWQRSPWAVRSATTALPRHKDRWRCAANRLKLRLWNRLRLSPPPSRRRQHHRAGGGGRRLVMRP